MSLVRPATTIGGVTDPAGYFQRTEAELGPRYRLERPT